MFIRWLTTFLLCTSCAHAAPASTDKSKADYHFHMGLNYYHGLGDQPDFKRAFEHFKAAAFAGSVKANGMLGRCHQLGRGTAKHPDAAVGFFQKGAELEDPIAQFHLGNAFLEGNGVAANPITARRWFLKAAEHGHLAAMANIGSLYETGQGVPRDEAQALKWYQQAARRGLPAAQCSLGAMLASGRGTPADPVQAAAWYGKAAEQGHARAQFLLGAAQFLGRGVTQDPVQAFHWMSLAANQGHENATLHRDTIGKTLTRDQLNAAAKLIAEFDQRHQRRENRVLPTAGRSGTGFFITATGHLITSHHLVAKAQKIEVHTGDNTVRARVLKLDPARGLALLHVPMASQPLPLGMTRPLRLNEPVFTVGFPDAQPKANEPKLAQGRLTSLTGPGGNLRHLRISVPLKPGNCGGALVDDGGLVVGVTTTEPSGPKSPNLHYAVNGTELVAFLTDSPQILTALPSPRSKPLTFAEAIRGAQAATVLLRVQP